MKKLVIFTKKNKDKEKRIIFKVLVGRVVLMCLLLVVAFLCLPDHVIMLEKWLAIWLANVDKKQKVKVKPGLLCFGNMLNFINFCSLTQLSLCPWGQPSMNFAAQFQAATRFFLSLFTE